MSAKKIEIEYRVGPLRAAGLEARWGRTSAGQPCLLARNPNAKSRHQRETWWVVDTSMLELMKRQGIVEGFHGATLLGDLFSVPA